jgi:suppressor for copper-sensitivity B
MAQSDGLLQAIGGLALALMLAASDAPAGAEEAKVRLIPAWTAVGESATVELGVHIQLAPGWKTYWRDPGEAGVPPAFDWTGSRNVAGAEIAFPAPKRFESYGSESFGYAGEVVLPVSVALEAAGLAAEVRLTLDYAVCKEICLPVRAELALALPAGPAVATPEAALIERFRQRVPRPEGGAFAIETVQLAGAPGAETLRVAVRALEGRFQAPELIAEGSATIRYGRPKRSLADDGMTARFELPVEAAVSDASAAGGEVRLTLIDGERAIERRLRAVPAS